MEVLPCSLLVDPIPVRFHAICDSDSRVVFRSHFHTNVELCYEVLSSRFVQEFKFVLCRGLNYSVTSEQGVMTNSALTETHSPP